MVDTTYYCTVEGHSPATSWQMGMYVSTVTSTESTVFNSWSAWCFSFFEVGVLHAFGYNTYQASSQGCDVINLYAVDPLTDHKVKVRTAAFPNSGTAAGPSLPPQLAPLVLLRTAESLDRTVGRLYLPPFASQGISVGAIGTTVRNNIRDFLIDAFHALTTNLVFPVVRNRRTHTQTPVARAAVSSIVATHKSRITPQLPIYSSLTL